MAYETIDRDQIDDIMAGKEPREPTGWTDMDSDDTDDRSGDVKAEEDSEQKSKQSGSDADESIGGTADQH